MPSEMIFAWGEAAETYDGAMHFSHERQVGHILLRSNRVRAIRDIVCHTSLESRMSLYFASTATYGPAERDRATGLYYSRRWGEVCRIFFGHSAGRDIHMTSRSKAELKLCSGFKLASSDL